MKKIRVALLGAGSISALHVESYQKLDHVEVMAICSRDGESAAKMAARYNIPCFFADYQEMLKLPEIDAVSITTWNSSHAAAGIAALNAGKHVLCEKPLAINAEAAQQMAAAAQANGRLLMVGFCRRFEENVRALKELIAGGDLGEIYYAKAGMLRRWGNPGGWFAAKEKSGGGPVIDLGAHIIDLARYLMGNPQAVSVFASTFAKIGMKPGVRGAVKYTAAGGEAGNDVEDGATALVKFENGKTLFFETSWVQHIREDDTYLELYGDKAGARIGPDLELYESRGDYLVNVKPVIDKRFNSFEHIFNAEIAHFITCIREGTPCICPAADGVAVQQIIDAVYQSSITGHEVLL